ncbi:MAG: UDP-2,3-diacylglucosamine diphosphatase [Muribaculaceae bacterium]|nr:UDP-2,3-diacylglucosamine diphosphatase [Muribaculaceae bacterium]MDE7369439.1 UDP-2,3-diacylglucosamine diphosphatase [Muribaculaceae bacterium]
MAKRAYFISDLHLGASYMAPVQRQREIMLCNFLDSIADDADCLYLVGDILDYWFEYRNVVPRGYVRFFGALARLADRGVKITWLIGNHDIWIFDYLPNEIGMKVVDGPLVEEIFGSRFYIAHGDGCGKRTLGFRFIRSIFRNPICQKLYAAIHPRWTIPFAHSWSSHSRKAGYKDELSEIPPQDDPYLKFALDYNLQHPEAPAAHFVFGHRHIIYNYTVPGNCQVVILGDWINHFTYGVFDGKTLEIYRFNDK